VQTALSGEIRVKGEVSGLATLQAKTGSNPLLTLAYFAAIRQRSADVVARRRTPNRRLERSC